MSSSTLNNNPTTIGDYAYGAISKHSHKIFKYEKKKFFKKMIPKIYIKFGWR